VAVIRAAAARVAIGISHFCHSVGCDTMGDVIQWENGLSGSGGSERIFWDFILKNQAKKARKIRLNPPDPPNPFSHCITTFLSCTEIFFFSSKRDSQKKVIFASKSFNNGKISSIYQSIYGFWI
jgi:hypothetical protein